MSSGGNNAVYAVQTIVRDYHVYKEAWSTTVSMGQVLPCQQECGNVHYPYSVTIVERKTLVGHVLQVTSAVCSLFLRRNGVITCEVTIHTCGIPPPTRSSSPPRKMQKNLQIKLLWKAATPQNLRKFSPVKVSGYTVVG